jgi:serpin B
LTRLVLVAAIHFRGLWTHAFKQKDTKEDGQFTLLDGSHVEVPMMAQTQSFPVAELTKAVRGISLPYKDSSSSMVILLPSSAAALDILLQDKAALVKYFAQSKDWETSKVSLKLPKFKFNFSVDLADTIKHMGAPDLFNSSKLNLGGALEQAQGHGINVSNIFHQAWICVDELGTEAAAATAVVAMKRRRSADVVPEFFCDRPFIFGIICEGKITFIGKMMNPRSV